MSKLPEDLRLALEGLSLLNEKFLVPLGRLDRIIRICAESHERIDVAEKTLQRLQQQTEQAQRTAAQQAERSQERLKVLSTELVTLQGKWKEEETAQEAQRVAAQQRLEQLELAHAEKLRGLEKLVQEIEGETHRLEELRSRIRRAQTMEP